MDIFKIENTVADGDYISPAMGREYERGYISLMFFTNAAKSAIASPTTGTATFYASETGEQYGTIGQISAPDTGLGQTYTRLTFNGSIKHVKVALQGVDVATHFTAVISRFP